MRTRLPAGLLGLALLAPWASAEDGVAGFKFEPRLANTPEGAVFQVQGNAPGYPEGTFLHVTLLIEGRSRAPLRAAFVKVQVGPDEKGSPFSAEVTWPGRKLGPLPYQTRVELFLNEQSPPIRKILVQEFGWANDHCERLGTTETELGTPEERGSFAKDSLLGLRALVERYQTLRGQIHTAMDPAAPAPLDGLIEEFTKLEQDFVAYKEKFVLRLEGELIQRLDSANAGVFRSIRQASRDGAVARERLVNYENEFKSILAEIDSRRPLEPAKAHDEDDGQKKPEKE